MQEEALLLNGSFTNGGEAVNSAYSRVQCYGMRSEMACVTQEYHDPRNNYRHIAPNPSQGWPDCYECLSSNSRNLSVREDGAIVQEPPLNTPFLSPAQPFQLHNGCVNHLTSPSSSQSHFGYVNHLPSPSSSQSHFGYGNHLPPPSSSQFHNGYANHLPAPSSQFHNGYANDLPPPSSSQFHNGYANHLPPSSPSQLQYGYTNRLPAPAAPLPSQLDNAYVNQKTIAVPECGIGAQICRLGQLVTPASIGSRTNRTTRSDNDGIMKFDPRSYIPEKSLLQQLVEEFANKK